MNHLVSRLRRIALTVERDALGMGKPEPEHVTQRRELLSYIELLLPAWDECDGQLYQQISDSIKGVMRSATGDPHQ